MSEHTPGPYKRFKDGSMIVNDDPRTGVIATVHRNAGPGEEPAQFEANAELFAAAPETAAERDRLREVRASALLELAAGNGAEAYKILDTLDVGRDRLKEAVIAFLIELEGAQWPECYDPEMLGGKEAAHLRELVVPHPEIRLAALATAKPKEPADHE